MKTKRAIRHRVDPLNHTEDLRGVIRHGDYKDMTDAEILRRVREMLPGKWTQGSNALNKWLLPTSPMKRDAVMFCLRGACIRVLEPSPSVLSTDLHVERSAISHQIASALGFSSSSHMVQWNDTQGRTEEEVLARIDKYIAINEKEK